MTVEELYNLKKINIEKILTEYDEKSYVLQSEIEKDFFAEEYRGEAEINESDKNEFIKWILFAIINYFQILMVHNSDSFNLNNQTSDIPVSLESKLASYNFADIANYALKKSFGEMLNLKPDELKERIEGLEQYLTAAEKDIKEEIKEFLKEDSDIAKNIETYFSFLQDDKTYVSNSFYIDFKKSLKNFSESGGCKKETFVLVLAFFFDFLNSKLPEEERFSKNVITYVYSVALMADKNLALSMLSDLIMNKLYILQQVHYRELFFNDPKNLVKFKNEYSSFFCQVFFEEESFVSMLKMMAVLNKNLYQPFFDLFNFTFNKDFKLENTNFEFLKKIWEIKDIQLSQMPGILYCISRLFEKIDKDDIAIFFENTNLTKIKKEYDKLNGLPGFNPRKMNGADFQLVQTLFNPQTQKEKHETFVEKIPLLTASIFYYLYELYIQTPLFHTITLLSDKLSQEEKDKFSENRKEELNSADRFHEFFIKKEYLEQKSIDELLQKISTVSIKKNFFKETQVNFEENSEDACRILYYLSRAKTDNLHAMVDFLNHVREKQLKVLPVLPNKYLTYTEKESQAEIKKLQDNQKILREKIDIGFTCELKQPVSSVMLSITPYIVRKINLKTFTETDKEYKIYSYKQYDKKTKKFLYYKLDKKENFRVTNKNLLNNHYLYSDRNVITHEAANYMVIENLLDDDHSDSLLFALADIRRFLNCLKNDLNQNKKYYDYQDTFNQELLGIEYLQLDLKKITDRMWDYIIYEDDKALDPWKTVFDKDKIRDRYKDRVDNLDYSHDFGPNFLKLLNDFLTNIYYTKPHFLLDADFAVYFYLIFQNFALEKYRGE